MADREAKTWYHKNQRPHKMEAALDVLLYPMDLKERGYIGHITIYVTDKVRFSFDTRWSLKTKEAAVDRMRRETKQFLIDLRAQIDDVLSKIDTRQMDEHDMISVESFAYAPREFPAHAGKDETGGG